MENAGLARTIANRYSSLLGIPAEDLYQTALLAFFRCLDRRRFNPKRGQLSTYIGTAARRDFERLYNKTFKTLTFPMNTGAHLDKKFEPASADSPSTPDELASSAEDRERVRVALRRLSAYDRKILMGKGRDAGVPLSTLNFQIGRAKQRLLLKLLKGTR